MLYAAYQNLGFWYAAYILKHDSVQGSSLDAKLPFAELSSDKRFGGSFLTSDSFIRQWEFVRLIFFRALIPQVFVTNTIMPFLGQESKGERKG